MGMINAGEKARNAYSYLLEKEPPLGTFEGRLHFQKASYLMKLAGVDFGGAQFFWYQRGPYAIRLGGIFPGSSEKGDSDLTRNEKKILQKKGPVLKEFLKNPNKSELYSSVGFLLHEERLSPDEVRDRMQLMKPWFKEKRVLQAVKRVQKYFPASSS